MKPKARPANDTEYNAINEQYKKDYHILGYEDDYEDIDSGDIIVYDINDDFKLIFVNYCGIYMDRGNRGKQTVTFSTDRFAYKYGSLYLYESDDDSDVCEEDIDELFK
jgi:hypothetical protein